MNARVWVASVLLVAACGSKKQRDALPVGLLYGGTCTYAADAKVAEITSGGKYAHLLGPGELTETCGDSKTVYDVLAPTEIKIDGPDTVKVGAKAPEYSLKVMAGARELTGPAASNSSPDWQLGADCAGLATYDTPLGAQDTGGREIERSLNATKAGACTLTVELLGVRGKRTVTIQ